MPVGNTKLPESGLSIIRNAVLKMLMLKQRNQAPKQFWLILLFVVAGFCAFILMYWITDHGPGVSTDSTKYIEAARNIAAGNGFFVRGKALTHYPPIYPMLIAGVDLLHPGGVLHAARILAALLFGANLVLFGLAAHICTKRNLAATGLAMLVFLSSTPILFIHSMAWSEAPYITFSMASFLLFTHYVMHLRPYMLVLAALTAGFAATTRYVGVVLFPTIALTFFLLDNRSVKLKIRDMILFAGVASLPLATWLIRNILIAQSATNRELTFHPVSWGHIKSLIHTMYRFVLPISISPTINPIFIVVVVVFFLFGLAIIYSKTHSKQNAASMNIVLLVLCVIYSVIYVMFLFVSISFIDAHTPLDSRILLPAILALTVASITLAWSLSKALERRWIWYGFVLLALFSVSTNAIYTVGWGIEIHKNGTGYTSRHWKNSEIIAYLSNSHDVRTIYSNGPYAIRFLTDKEAMMMPTKVSPTTREVNEDYEVELNQMIQECREGKALIVYFSDIKRWYLASIEEMESTGNLPVLSRTQDGIIYGTR